HRRPDRLASPRGPVGPRGRPADAVHEQPETDRPRVVQLRERQRRPAPTSILYGVEKGSKARKFKSNWSVLARITLFLEASPLYNAMNFDYKNSDVQNTTISMTVISSYLCPSDPSPAVNPSNGYAQDSHGNVVGDWYVWEELGQVNRVVFSP